MVKLETSAPLPSPDAKYTEYASSYAQSSIRYLTWGIFEIAYEAPSFGSEILSFDLFDVTYLDKFWEPAKSTLRLLKGLFRRAPIPFLGYWVSLLWLAIAPGISLRLAHDVLLLLFARIPDPNITAEQKTRETHSFVVILWLCSALLSTFASRSMEEQKYILGGHLRAHYLPLLADASLDFDADSKEDFQNRAFLPNPWAFGEETPGWEVIHELSTRLRNILTLCMECLSLVHIIRRTSSPDAEVLGGLGIFVVFLIIFTPSNGAGGSGYTFWTKNKAYLRLLTLYSTIFDDAYRESRLKDGIADYLSEEYKRTSEELGIVKSNTLTLACTLPPPWYWTFAQTLVIDYPMALYGFVICRSSSPESLVSIALFQYGINTLSQSIYSMRVGQDSDSLLDVMKKAQNLFNVIDRSKTMGRETCQDICPGNNSRGGLKISFQNVSLCYGDPKGPRALNCVTFDIHPGELVVLVGSNGSGKSSLLKVMTGLASLTEGDLLIQGRSINECDTLQFRRRVAFISQSDEIYPVSLRENILMGLGSGGRDLCDLETKIETAARLGGSLPLVKRLGSHTILRPCRIVGQSVRGCGNGEIGARALRELEKNDHPKRDISISAGEKQRLIASRCIMRIQHRFIELVLLDEATSALDPIAERSLFEQFIKMKGDRTMIFVTHRFGNFVKKADRILCMDNGKLVQNGTHEQLIRQAGKYKELFNAQASIFLSSSED